MHPHGFAHDIFVEVIPHVEGSEPSEAQKGVDIRSGSKCMAFSFYEWIGVGLNRDLTEYL